MADSNAAIDAMVGDIDADVVDHVHLLFYIWLPDNNGCQGSRRAAASRAARVTVRAMADALGSRLMIKSAHWQAMRDSGIQVAVALPIANPLLRPSPVA